MNDLLTSFQSADLEKLQKEFEVLTFPNDFDLVYQDQIPSAGIAVVEGALELLKNSKVMETINPGQVIGISHLLEEIPFKFVCRVKANSKIILIGKSKLLSSIKNKRSPLYPLLRPFRAEKR
ncbi:MAG: hypothetical protein ACLGHN_01665 [Bacteriovoracia bacterium]